MNRRVCKFLRAIEDLLDSLSCDATSVRVIGSKEDGSVELETIVRRWHPAFWIGWVRVRLLGDRFGAAFYDQPRVNG